MWVLRLANQGRPGQQVELFLLKPIQLYFLAALSVLITMVDMEDGSKPLPLYAYAIIGSLTLYFYLSGKVAASKVQITINQNEMDVRTYRNARIESIWIAVALVFFNFSLWYPLLVETELNQQLMVTIEAIYRTPVIGWIVAFLGVIFLLRTIFRSLMLTNKFINFILGKEEPPAARPSGPTIEDVDYVEATDEEEEKKDPPQLR